MAVRAAGLACPRRAANALPPRGRVSEARWQSKLGARLVRGELLSSKTDYFILKVFSIESLTLDITLSKFEESA